MNLFFYPIIGIFISEINLQLLTNQNKTYFMNVYRYINQ